MINFLAKEDTINSKACKKMPVNIKQDTRKYRSKLYIIYKYNIVWTAQPDKRIRIHLWADDVFSPDDFHS